MSVLVCREAPNFIAQAVFADNSIKEFNFKEYTKGKYCVLFFYPLNFTFVCPTEIIAFDNMIHEFEKRDTLVVGVSVDSAFSHLEYKNKSRDEGGIGNIRFPLVADLTKRIAHDYDVLNPISSVALRGTFLIDKNGIVRHQNINDAPLGRNVQEMLRLVDALQYVDTHGEVCPANWNKDKEAMVPDRGGVAKYLKKNAQTL